MFPRIITFILHLSIFLYYKFIAEYVMHSIIQMNDLRNLMKKKNTVSITDTVKTRRQKIRLGIKLRSIK